jgi:hypothetical protein
MAYQIGAGRCRSCTNELFGSTDVPPGSNTVTFTADGEHRFVELNHDGLPAVTQTIIPRAGAFTPRLVLVAVGLDPGPDQNHL